jgi:hypothetical protein
MPPPEQLIFDPENPIANLDVLRSITPSGTPEDVAFTTSPAEYLDDAGALILETTGGNPSRALSLIPHDSKALVLGEANGLADHHYGQFKKSSLPRSGDKFEQALARHALTDTIAAMIAAPHAAAKTRFVAERDVLVGQLSPDDATRLPTLRSIASAIRELPYVMPLPDILRLPTQQQSIWERSREWATYAVPSRVLEFTELAVGAGLAETLSLHETDLVLAQSVGPLAARLYGIEDPAESTRLVQVYLTDISKLPEQLQAYPATLAKNSQELSHLSDRELLERMKNLLALLPPQELSSLLPTPESITQLQLNNILELLYTTISMARSPFPARDGRRSHQNMAKNLLGGFQGEIQQVYITKTITDPSALARMRAQDLHEYTVTALLKGDAATPHYRSLTLTPLLLASGMRRFKLTYNTEANSPLEAN